MGMRQHLPPHEVNRFKEHYFECAPAILSQSPNLARPEEAFEALVAGCRAAAHGRALLKVFVNGTQVTTIRHPVLPREDEPTLANYLSRLLADATVQDFAIVFPSLQVHSPLICNRARVLLGELLGDDWMPTGSIDLELFFGRYEYTPGGIHKEPRSNLHCVVAGRKSMLVWPEKTWDETGVPQLGVLQYLQPSDAQHEAAILAGKGGDILYWPPNYWHVGTSPEFSIGINIAIYVGSDPFEMLTKAVAGQLWSKSKELGLLDEPVSRGSGACELPNALHQQLKALQLTAGSPSLATALAVEWMTRLTGLAFRPPSGRREASDLPNTVALARTVGGRLSWKTVGPELIYSGNGHVGRVRASAGATEMLELVVAGRPFTVQQMVALSANIS